MVKAFEKDANGKFVNFDLKTGELISSEVKARIRDLVDAIVAKV